MMLVENTKQNAFINKINNIYIKLILRELL